MENFHPKDKSIQLLSLALVAYTVSIGVLVLPSLAFVGNKLQAPEFVFLFGVLPATYLCYKQNRPVWEGLNAIDWGVLVYLLGITVSTLANGDITSYLQLLGVYYLAALLFIVKYWVVLYQKQTSLQQKTHKTDLDYADSIGHWVALGFTYLGCSQAILGIAGWLMWRFGLLTALVQERPSFLYFGATARAQGTTGDPNMLASILVTCLLFLVVWNVKNRMFKKVDVAVLMLLLVGLLLTMSKQILLLPLVVFCLNTDDMEQFSLSRRMAFGEHFFKKINLLMRVCASFSLVLMLWVTHFYMDTSGQKAVDINRGGTYISETPWAKIGGITLYPTCYTIIKLTSWRAFVEHPIVGIGLNQQGNYTAALQQKGQFPAYFEAFDSHCSYTGALAETGLLGFTGYCVLVSAFLGLIFLRMKKNKTRTNDPIIRTFAALSLLLLAFSLEAWVIENNTFRHFWLTMGAFSGLLTYKFRTFL